jgi:hypothetical protein
MPLMAAKKTHFVNLRSLATGLAVDVLSEESRHIMEPLKTETNGVVADSRVLSSWKDIAECLGVSPKTAQGYEKTRGLPIRRVGNRPTILESELRAWQLSQRAPLRWWGQVRILQWWAFSATGLFLILAITWATQAWLSSRAGQPAALHWDGPVLTAVDAQGRRAWQHQFPYQLMDTPSLSTSLTPWMGDLDGSGKISTVLAYYHVKREAEGWDLYCISSKGDIRWRLRPDRDVRNANHTFSPPYVLRSFVVFPSPEKDKTRWTAGVFVHHTGYPSVLLVVDSTGKPRGEFWHVGHLNVLKALDLDGDGIVKLIAGGVQHGADQAVLIVLDPRNIHGAARLESADSALQFRDMAAGTERAVVYFPRTEINKKFDQFNVVFDLDIVGDSIQASVYESLRPEGYLIYTLNRDLTVKDLTISVSYMNAIKQLTNERAFNALTGQAEIQRLKQAVRVVRR